MIYTVRALLLSIVKAMRIATPKTPDISSLSFQMKPKTVRAHLPVESIYTYLDAYI